MLRRAGWIGLVMLQWLGSGVAFAQALDLETLSAEHEALVAAHEQRPSQGTTAALVDAAEEATTVCEKATASRGVTFRNCVAAVRLTQAALGPDHPDVATSLNDLAERLRADRAFAQAEPLVRRALAIREAALGPDHPDVAISLSSLALLHHAAGDYARAEPLHRRSLAILEAARGPDHESVATGLDNLAALLRETGRYAEAEPLLRRVLGIRQAARGPEHPVVARSLNNLAVLLSSSGRYAEAQELHVRALAIREAALGPDHIDVATSLNNLATVFDESGAYAKAEPLYRRAHAIFESVLGPDHPDVARILNNQGELLRRTGRYAEAEPLLRRGLAIREAAWGPDHPDVAFATSALAGLLHDVGRYAEAETLYERALAIREAVLGPDHLMVGASLHNLAGLLGTAGAYERAEPLLRRGHAIFEAILPPGHPYLATSTDSLAGLLADTGAHEEAQLLYRRALTARETVLGPDHPTVAASLNNLAFSLGATGGFDEAERLLRRALAIYDVALGPDHPDVALCTNTLAQLLRNSGRLAEAEPLLRRALAIRRAALGPEHPDVAISMDNLASLLEVTGSYAEAESSYSEALEILQVTLASDHPDVSTNLNNQSWLHLRQGKVSSSFDLLARALEVEEAHLANTLFATSPERRRLRLDQFRGSTWAAVWLNLAHLPESQDAARLALETLLRRKGRLADLQQDTLARIRQAADADARASLEELQRTTAALGVLQDRPPRSAEELEAWRVNREQLTAQVETLQRELGERSAGYRRATRRVTAADVASALPASSGLLELAVYRPWEVREQEWDQGEARYAGYLLLPDRRIRAVDLGPAREVDADARAFREALVARQPLAASADALFRRTLAPLADDLAGIEHLYVAADGLLNLMPFEGLIEAPNSGLGGLSLSYLTSGRDLIREPVAIEPGTSVVVFDVDPDAAVRRPAPEGERASEARWTRLPGTLDEGRAVGRVVRPATRLTAAEATETAMRRIVRPRVLHVASHGFFASGDDQKWSLAGTRSQFVNPGRAQPRSSSSHRSSASALLRSGVVLSGANLPPAGDDNGLLTAAELANLDLRGTTLAVLSACETGTGEIRNGDGVLGLRRALVLAGAQAQVLSLWQVDDAATAALMKAFYRQLRKGRPVGDALRRAQAQIRKRAEWSHPFYWAAFTVSGNANARL